jgi:hypothetical protein
MEKLKIKLYRRAIMKHGINNIEPCKGENTYSQCYTELTRINKITKKKEKHLALWYNVKKTNSTQLLTEVIK